MLHIGCHLSASAGYLAMAKETVRIGGDTFQFFTRNPRGGRAKDIDPNDVTAFLAYAAEHHFATILAHAPYTLNPCAQKEETLQFARQTMADDLKRMEYTPHQFYNFHPGCHVGQGDEVGIDLIAQTVNEAMFDGMTTTVLLETMAGKGTEVGRTFEQLRAIMDRVTRPEHIGVCLDTCHVWDAGYDIVHNLDGVLEAFDKTIGLEHLRAIHLNDSRNPCGAHKDRHEKIGQGYIGFDALVSVTRHKALCHLPFFLETPQSDNDGYAREIAMLRDAT